MSAEPTRPRIDSQGAEYPAPSAWGESPALDDGWNAPAPEYAATAAALDSLHQPAPLPEVEARPGTELLHPWDRSKTAAVELSTRLDRHVSTLTEARKVGTCQSYLVFSPLVDGRWAVSDTRRCSERICPNNALARARKLRPQIDRLADGIRRHGQIAFATFTAGRPSPAELWDAWRLVQQSRAFKADVLGHFVGLHLSDSLRAHLHAVIVLRQPKNQPRTRSTTLGDLSELMQLESSKLPELVQSNHAAPLLAFLWQESARKVGLTAPAFHVEPVQNAPASLQYIARPASPALVDDARLPELLAILKGIRTLRTAGIVREYWGEDDDEARPDWLGDRSSSRRYGWQPDLEAYDITPP